LAVDQSCHTAGLFELVQALGSLTELDMMSLDGKTTGAYTLTSDNTLVVFGGKASSKFNMYTFWVNFWE